MPLSPSTRLGAYEILALIGQGGMGEVYRARDTRLGRDVAVKVLPPDFASDPDRMGRFEREARVLASLQHSNIAVLYGLEESGDVRALVMELVEGPTLADRIAQGPIPVEEAVPLALQIVEALDYAHERGVIHRDLKPANVKLTPEGSGSKVKLLDFGLAKALTDVPVTASLPDSPTLTLGATQAGVILGTAAYMSPEQVNGKPADRRADIWAFGVVLYEMLTARRPFQGDTTAEILSAVMKDSPPLELAPVPMQPLLQRCLQKNPRQRLQAIGEARIALEQPAPRETATATRLTRRAAAWAAIAIVTTALTVLAFSDRLTPAPPGPRPSIHFAATLPPILVSPRAAIALSADGSRVVFTGGGPQQPLYVRALNEAEVKPLAGTEGATNPTFSPDGQWIAYLLFRAGNGQLMKIPTGGGEPKLVSGFRYNFPILWGADQNIYLSSFRSLMRVPAGGGKVDTVALPDSDGSDSYHVPFQFLPGNRMLIGTGRDGDSPTEVAILDLETGGRRTALMNAGRAWYTSTGPGPSEGHLVYQGADSLLAVSFDLERMESRGSPISVLDGSPSFSVSDAGTLAYLPRADVQRNFKVAWVNREGVEQPGLDWFQASRMTSPPRLAPDGTRMAVVDQGDVWVYELARGTRNRLTSDGVNSLAVWTRDGRSVVYSSGTGVGGSLFSVPSDKSAPPTALLSNGKTYVPTAVSPDGQLIAREGTPADAGSIYVAVPLVGNGRGAEPKRLFQSPYQVTGLQVSPDGRLMAYQSNEAGRSEIYVAPFPGPGPQTAISSSGGSGPRWGDKGELFFVDGSGRLVAVEIQSSPTFRVGVSRALFDGATGGFDPAPGGQRFLMPKPTVANAKPSELHIVVNWVDDLRRRVR
jgi:Tol biopolymer transport system component